MLWDAFKSRRMLLILDGIDEAVDLREIVTDFILELLLPHSHRFIATSRPTGITSHLRSAHGLVVLDLKRLTEEQQRGVVEKQLKGRMSTFMGHVFTFAEARRRLDETFIKCTEGRRTCTCGQSDASDAVKFDLFKSYDSNKSKKGYGFLDDGRQTVPGGEPVSDWPDLHAMAKSAKPFFDAICIEMASDLELPVVHVKTKVTTEIDPKTGDIVFDKYTESPRLDKDYTSLKCGVMLAPVKSMKRAVEKAEDKYNGDVVAGRRGPPAISWVSDMVRGSFLCCTYSMFRKIYEAICEHPLLEAVRVKNFFVKKDPIHLRRLSLSVRMRYMGDGIPVFHM